MDDAPGCPCGEVHGVSKGTRTDLYDYTPVKVGPDEALSPDNLRDLFRVAGAVSDDPGDQVWLAVMAIKAGVSAAGLAERAAGRPPGALWSPLFGPPSPEVEP